MKCIEEETNFNFNIYKKEINKLKERYCDDMLKLENDYKEDKIKLEEYYAKKGKDLISTMKRKKKLLKRNFKNILRALQNKRKERAQI